MKSKPSQKQFQLQGKVVQTFEISGERAVKIFIKPFSIDLLIELNEEVSLGDVITLEVSINDKSLKSVTDIVNPLPF